MKQPSRSVYYVGAEGAYPALTTYLVSSTIDAIEMPDLGENPAEAPAKCIAHCAGFAGLNR